MKQDFLDPQIYLYLSEINGIEPDVIRELREYTETLPEANMLTTPDQGRFLKMLVQLMGAHHVLEIGTFTGYSALWMMLGLPEEGTLTSLDTNAPWNAVARRFWEKAGVDHKATSHIGLAHESLHKLAKDGSHFDLVFVDADKQRNQQYLDLIDHVTRPGSLIIFDNVLWKGKVADPSVDDITTQMIREFNLSASHDTRFDSLCMPMGDGMLLLRKR